MTVGELRELLAGEPGWLPVEVIVPVVTVRLNRNGRETSRTVALEAHPPVLEFDPALRVWEIQADAEFEDAKA